MLVAYGPQLGTPGTVTQASFYLLNGMGFPHHKDWFRSDPLQGVQGYQLVRIDTNPVT